MPYSTDLVSQGEMQALNIFEFEGASAFSNSFDGVYAINKFKNVPTILFFILWNVTCIHTDSVFCYCRVHSFSVFHPRMLQSCGKV